MIGCDDRRLSDDDTVCGGRMDGMDVKDYRKSFEAALAAKPGVRNSGAALAAGPVGGTVHGIVRSLLSRNVRMPETGDAFSTNVAALLAAVRDANAPLLARKAAMRALRTAAFLAEKFAPHRAAFLAGMRELAQSGTDPELCRDALEALAAEKDPEAQRILELGLREPDKALVPPTTALQFLGYDDHAGIADLALDIFHRTADLSIKEAALRVLAGASKSQDLFEQLLTDKSQPRSLRALSATGLNFLNPEKFAAIARDIIMDDGDFDDIRATSLGALANAKENILHNDQSLLSQVVKLGIEGAHDSLRAAAGRLIKKP